MRVTLVQLLIFETSFQTIQCPAYRRDWQSFVLTSILIECSQARAIYVINEMVPKNYGVAIYTICKSTKIEPWALEGHRIWIF